MDIPSPRVPLCPSHKALPPRSLCSSPPLSGGAPSSRRRSGPVALRPAPSCLVGWCTPSFWPSGVPRLAFSSFDGRGEEPRQQNGTKTAAHPPHPGTKRPGGTRRRRPTATPAPGTPPEREGGGAEGQGREGLGGRSEEAGVRGLHPRATRWQGRPISPSRVTPKKMTAFIIAVGSCIRSFGKA